jgi:hypothetical protein
MVIRLERIEVRGYSEAGPFTGALNLAPGLQVVSARNSYGKSLAAKAFAWCLGIEPMFGLQDNDPVFFPEAAREEIEFPGLPPSRVVSSESSVTFVHDNGRRVALTRSIRGGDCTTVLVREEEGENVRESKLRARRETMQDQFGGLQRFLFDWLKWPRQTVTTFRGGKADIYLENLAPLFDIDQDEGWTNIQALQIGRYGQQQIAEIAVEYLLGSVEAIQARVARQQTNQRNAYLRETARELAERVVRAFLARGWRVDWSGNGPLDVVISRWSARRLRDALADEANVDFPSTRAMLDDRAEKLRNALTKAPIDASNATTAAAASQRVVELKGNRHRLNAELNSLRTQHSETSVLLASLEHRIQSASDLLRLKKSGVGRLDHVECPTCHRDLDPATFALTDQSELSISSHIEALRRDRDLMRKGVESIEDGLITTRAAMEDVDRELRDAERALVTVTSAIGTVREQLAKTASDLIDTERDIDRLVESVNEISELQRSVDEWIKEAKAVGQLEALGAEIEDRRAAFLTALKRYLLALGHSAVTQEAAPLLQIDDQYVPYLAGRRLRSLGSASDQARLVAAYSLGLAAASEHVAGFHPGFVLLDEPQQQNPDDQHRELFLTFLSQQLAREAKFQTVIFTWLRDDEIAALRGQGTNVITPEGEHFLQLIPPPTEPEQKPDPEDPVPDEAGSLTIDGLDSPQ